MIGNQHKSISAHAATCSDPARGPGEGLFYEIRVEGHLDPGWSDWLEGLEVSLLENGEMILRGPIVDQAALLGILNKLGRLNLALVSVNRVRTKEGGNDERNPNTQA